MKTSEYIQLLSLDSGAKPTPSHRLLIAGALVGGLVLALIFIGLVPKFRPNLFGLLTGNQVADRVFQIKMIFCILLPIFGLVALVPALRPHKETGRRPWLAIGWISLLAIQSVFLLYAVPMLDWANDLFVFQYSIFCVALVLATSAPFFALLFWAARHLAPTDPAQAGRLIGLTAGGCGSAVYALHCSVDNAVYMFSWYGSAWFILITLGGWLGPRLLRW